MKHVFGGKQAMQQNPKIYQGKIIAVDLMKSCFTILADNQKTCTLPFDAWQEPFDIQIGDEVEFGKNEQGVWVRLKNTSDTSLLHNADAHQVGFSQLMQQPFQHQKLGQQFEKSDFHNTQFQEKETLYDNHVREVIDYPYGFFGSYLYTWKRCFDYKGRSRRKEYWYFNLMILAMCAVMAIVFLSNDRLIEFMIFILIHLLPLNALIFRRFHDIGFSGWSIILFYVPYLNIVLAVVLALMGGELEENDWGSPVK